MTTPIVKCDEAQHYSKLSVNMIDQGPIIILWNCCKYICYNTVPIYVFRLHFFLPDVIFVYLESGETLKPTLVFTFRKN